MNNSGEMRWYIPDGHIPAKSMGELTSHEAICILNTSEADATLDITIYFEDREPMKEIIQTVPKQRTKHIRTDLLNKNSEYIPKGIQYAMEITSNTPIIVQYSRLDATQPANALMTTVAFSPK